MVKAVAVKWWQVMCQSVKEAAVKWRQVTIPLQLAKLVLLVGGHGEEVEQR